MISLPIVIVGHPARERLVNRLAEQVNAEAISWDISHIGCARNHIQAWQWLAESDHSWGVVLEDDVIPCGDFYRNLVEAIAVAPAPIVSLYLPRGRPPQFQQPIARVITREVSFLRMPALLGTQGYAMRGELFGEYDWLSYYLRQARCGIDEVISAWAAEKGYGIAACRRSLVDHLDGPSLIADHGDGRGRGPGTKTQLVTSDCDPAGADHLLEVRKAWLMASGETRWDSGSVPLPTV